MQCEARIERYPPTHLQSHIACRLGRCSWLGRLEDFEWQFNPNINRRQIYELAAGNYLRGAQNVLFIGPPGVGKTHLAQALGYEAIKQGREVFYRSIFDLVRDFLEEEALSGQEKTLRRYLKPDLLIIVDMGLKSLPKRSGEYLLEVILRRHENRSTIMTSNRPLEEWGKLLSDVPTAGAILDRFLQRATIIPIQGRSYRVKDLGLGVEQSTAKGRTRRGAPECLKEATAEVEE